ncbi:hypothetical protein Lal_00009357 [Lupinus albus]|nr:hypothetical protein Lal_00009357 [Lupinus albus]
MTARIKNAALWGVGLATAVLIVGGSMHLDQPAGARAAAANAAAPAAVPVTVATVKPKTVTTWEEFSGRLEAVDRVQIRPRVAGAIQSAQGEVASAQAKLELAESELERGKTLLARNTISQSELAQRQSNYSSALATLQSAKATLKVAELNLGYTEIKSPIAGRVGRIEVTVGNLVAGGSTSEPLTTLLSVDPIYASFDVNEELLLRLVSGLPVKDGLAAIEQIPVEVTTLDNANPVAGRLQLINNEINAASGTIRVRAVFSNPDGRLLPGQFVRIRMGQPKAEERLVVSEKAVGTDQDKKFVLVVDAANTVAYRQIELGAAVDGARIVEKGLNAGDRIVVNGLQRVRPGAVVQPQEQTAANN